MRTGDPARRRVLRALLCERDLHFKVTDTRDAFRETGKGIGERIFFFMEMRVQTNATMMYFSLSLSLRVYVSTLFQRASLRIHVFVTKAYLADSLHRALLIFSRNHGKNRPDAITWT